MLKEGDIIKVEILKEITTPKGKPAFLALYHSRKFIIGKNLFEDKQPIIGESIDCFVDKVNCSGQIYITPLFSQSLIGQIQTFKLRQKVAVIDSLGKPKYLYQLNNLKNQKAEILSYHSIDFDQMECKIIGVKKNKLTLESPLFPDYSMSQNTLIKVKIIEERIVNNIGKCWIAQDNKGELHPISKEKFQHYNLSIGERISCSILGFDRYFNYKLEPKNPYYKVGKTYNFKTIGNSQLKDESGNINNLIIVEDAFGKEVTIAQMVNQNTLPKIIKAEVYRITNGRVYIRAADNLKS
jgi:hypothetical protein